MRNEPLRRSLQSKLGNGDEGACKVGSIAKREHFKHAELLGEGKILSEKRGGGKVRNEVKLKPIS